MCNCIATCRWNDHGCYISGQWSPCNPEGKKQYDRDFLHALSKDPKSLVKPMNLPQMDIIKDKANPAKINSAFNKNPGDFMPNFIKQTISRGVSFHKANTAFVLPFSCFTVMYVMTSFVLKIKCEDTRFLVSELTEMS